ncbi:MAG: thiolase family protein [Actinobacteria bacterium]|nr:thiolase family protein [Actinomycetota bacterium]
MTPAYIVDAVRTPVGRLGGALAAVRPDDLAAGAIRALLALWPGVDPTGSDPAPIDEVYVGDANQAGEDNRNVARMACLLAGLPTTVPGGTVNRLCGSGLDAIACASRAIAVGDADLAIAGGVESMSRAPWVLQKPAKGYPTGHEQLWSTTLGWRMTNPAMPQQWTVALGEGAELLAERHSIGRDEQDQFALQSHQRADAAWSAGWFADEVVPVATAALERDECIRADTTLDKLASLKPVFRPDGTVTAGNSSPMNDGASMLLLASEAGLARTGAMPLARIVSRATSGVDPHLYGIGPVESVRLALERAGITWADLDAVELNEAFAAQSLACLREMPELDPSIVNTQGGAIALGHALGGSGARIVTTLAHRLRRTGGRYGLATMCIGVGQGIAMVLESTGSAP